MPALSPTMEAGNIASWSVEVGQSISAGDVLAQIETDKATVDFEATDDGVVAQILIPGGAQDVAVGTPLIVLVDDADDVAAFKDYVGAASTEAAPAAPTPAPAPAPAPTPAPTPAPASTPAKSHSNQGRIFASPLAKKLAREKGINLAAVSGTGPNGRIIKADIVALGNSRPEVPAKAASVTLSHGDGDFQDIPHTQIRKVIASRLTMSKSTIPHYYLSMECKMDELMKTRAEVNAHSEVKISVNDFVVKAAAAAMKDVPSVNAQWTDDAIRMFNNVDVCVAVATPNGLLTPVVQDVPSRGLASISTQVRDMATRARDNKLTPAELSGGTFTISNLGMFGIAHFCAVINPPQAAILAVGATQQRVVPQGTSFGVENVMTVTLSCDHRVIDGAVGSEWLQSFKKYIENPVAMIA
jgi:pyruvate dehydrogenase E2 component (dihydrolipoamide acetyltransferase)